MPCRLIYPFLKWVIFCVIRVVYLCRLPNEDDMKPFLHAQNHSFSVSTLIMLILHLQCKDNLMFFTFLRLFVCFILKIFTIFLMSFIINTFILTAHVNVSGLSILRTRAAIFSSSLEMIVNTSLTFVFSSLNW